MKGSALKHHKFLETSYAHRDPGDSLVLVGYNGNYSGILFFKTRIQLSLKERIVINSIEKLNWTVPFPFICRKDWGCTLLVVQWLRICLRIQGTQVQSLVQEDPTCHWAAKPDHYNSWSWGTPEPTLHNKRRHRNEEKPPFAATRENPSTESRPSAAFKSIKVFKEFKKVKGKGWEWRWESRQRRNSNGERAQNEETESSGKRYHY